MEFTSMLEELKSTTSKTEKEDILGDYLYDENDGDFIRFLLKEAFDPNLLHHVKLKKSALPEEGVESIGDCEDEIRNMFDRLHNCYSSQQNTSTAGLVMYRLDRENQEALLGVINKKLRCGFSIRTINKVWEDLIDVTKIQLANKYKPDKHHSYSRSGYVSDKLDGQRIFSLRSNGEGWKKYSRAGDYLGNEITTLDHWDEELEKYYERSGFNFLDGEAYLHGLTFEEISSLVSSSKNKKDATSLQYHIFFVGRTTDFKESSKKNKIAGIPPDTIKEQFNKKYQYLVGVKQEKMLMVEEKVFDRIDKAVEQGYEGVIIRDEKVFYDFKRSNKLLKAKKSDLSGTEEYIDAYVEDIEYGDFVVREDGVEAIEHLPVALWVVLPNDPSTKQMKVGSGFSLKDRRDWKEDEMRIVEQMIEVEFQGFGARGRMRFPRYLRVRSDL